MADIPDEDLFKHGGAMHCRSAAKKNVLYYPTWHRLEQSAADDPLALRWLLNPLCSVLLPICICGRIMKLCSYDYDLIAGIEESFSKTCRV